MIHVASDKTLALKNIWERVFVFDVVLPSVGTLMEINPNFSFAYFFICCVLYTARFICGCGMPKQADEKE